MLHCSIKFDIEYIFKRHKNRMNILLRERLFPIVLGAAILLFPAFLNGYPFIFPDSAGYIAGFGQQVHFPFYHWMIVASNFITPSIWMVVFLQSLATSDLIYSLLKCELKIFKPSAFLIAIGILMSVSSLPYFTGFIMPDIFTALIFLCIYLLLVHHKKLSRHYKIYLYILTLFAASAHSTNLFLGIGLLIFMSILLFIALGIETPIFKNIALVGLSLVIVATSAVTYYGVKYRAWTLLPSGNVFLMAAILDNGAVKQYLTKACPDAQYNICKYVSQIPNYSQTFLWGSEDGRRAPLNAKLGGFWQTRKEATDIVIGTIKTAPRIVINAAAKRFSGALLTHEPAAEIVSYWQHGIILVEIQKLYGAKSSADYIEGMQFKDKFPHRPFRFVNNIVFPFSIFVIIASFYVALQKRQLKRLILPLSVLVFFVADALLLGVTSGVYDRYQARVTWLAVLAAFILLENYRISNELRAQWKMVKTKTDYAVL